MSPWLRAACTIDDCIRIISISKPLAVKTPHSLAAKSGRAVMVKPALEILALARCSWAANAGRASKTTSRAARRKDGILFLLEAKIAIGMLRTYYAKSRLLDNNFVP